MIPSKYPFGRCAACGQEFTDELRCEYQITHCPWCGEKIDDFISLMTFTAKSAGYAFISGHMTVKAVTG